VKIEWKNDVLCLSPAFFFLFSILVFFLFYQPSGEEYIYCKRRELIKREKKWRCKEEKKKRRNPFGENRQSSRLKEKKTS